MHLDFGYFSNLQKKDEIELVYIIYVLKIHNNETNQGEGKVVCIYIEVL